jgi:streptogramin lyase
MTVSDGVWTGSQIVYGYQWETCEVSNELCTLIPGANSTSYTPTSADVGHKMAVLVTATNGGGTTTASTGPLGEIKGRVSECCSGETLPRWIAAGPDGYMWFATNTPGITKTPVTTGLRTSYTLPAGSNPYGIAAGPDGNLWFTEFASASKIGKITTSGTVTTYTLPAESYPNSIAAGPDGNLWFTDYSTNKVGKITTAGAVTEYSLGSAIYPTSITAGPDGNMWIAEESNKIAKVTMAGSSTQYTVPGHPYGIAAGPDGNLWFTEYEGNKVGKITTSGSKTEYSLPAGSGPRGIAAGPDGNLWFADYSSSKIGKVTTAGTVSEYSLPASSGPMGITKGPDGNMWFTDNTSGKVGKITLGTEGEERTPTRGWVMEYNAPLTAGLGLQGMTSSDVAKWGQTDVPVEATAILPPDADQGWPATSYTRATVYYLDAQGMNTNLSSPSNAPYGSIATTEYNEFNDEVRTLTADNRQVALEAGGESVDVAKLRATYYSYRAECSKESENKHETESLEPGNRLCDTEGPQHQIKYMAGSEQKEGLGRLHTKYFYDENAPGGETYNLLTKTSSIAQLANEEEVEVRKTTTSYSGQTNLGWKLRAPTSVTIDPEGKKLTTTTIYNSATGQVAETRAPAGSAGGSAHDTKYIYYTATENTEGYAACGLHPEWAGLLCETLPAKQPAAGAPPQLPVTMVTSYNKWNEPLVTTETFGSTVRTKTNIYASSERLTSSETTSTTGVALPRVDYEYNSKTGLREKQKITVEAKAKTITSKYNTFGQLSEYTDADGNIAKFRYGGVENDYLLEEMTDGSNGGTGRQTYTYNATTKAREELWDSAAGTFTASYDAEGKLNSEIYPNAMCGNYGRNSAGETTSLEYVKTTNCSEVGAPVWFSETRVPSVHGETFSRSNTLASETYVYDSVARLTETHETPAGEGCSTRLYAYDEESNRTSQTTRAPGVAGKCATEGGTVLSHTYDEGNRLTDAGIAYDSFGNVTKLPAADAEGHELSSTFYVSNAVATQSQNGVTNNYYLDGEGRVREAVSGATATVTHYDAPGEGVAWTSEGEGKSTRNIGGIDGTLSATQTNGGTPVLQLHDIQGNAVATAALSPTETKVLSTYNSTEFGVPNAGVAPPKYAWLGAADVASAFSSGVITYGATSYVPQTGRPLQSEAVDPPGSPQGTGAGAGYNSQEEPWVFQGAAAAGAEAPGLEAARERAALEAAWAAATDPVEVHYMNKTKARALAAKLWEAKSVGELAGAIAIPSDWVDAAVGLVAGLGLGDVYKWFDETAEMMSKCGNNKWNVVGVKPNICKIQYDVIHALGSTFVDFTTQAKVWECFDNSGETCFHEVYADKKEKSCALGGLICIA